MKRRFLVLLITCFMLTSIVTGCGNSANTTTDNNEASQQMEHSKDSNDDTVKETKDLKIALCMPVRDQFLTECEDNMKATAEEYGCDFVAFDANNDINTLLSQVAACSNDGYDAIISAVTDNSATKAIVDAAGETPVVLFCRGADFDALEEGKHVYVGCEQTDAGNQQAEWLANKFKDENIGPDVNIVLFMGELGNACTTDRTDAFKKTFADQGFNANYVFEDTALWDRSKSMEKFTQFMGTSTPIDAVVANNDDMALGVIEAYVAQGMTDIPVPVLGVDAAVGALDSIENGGMAFTTSQNAAGMGRSSVDCAISLALGEKIDGVQDGVHYPISFKPIDKSNIAEYRATLK